MRQARCTSTANYSGPDELLIYCPRLGGTVPFRYCLSPAEDLPCNKILDCWWQALDIQTYLKQHFSSDITNKIYERKRPDRVSFILELIKTHTEKVVMVDD